MSHVVEVLEHPPVGNRRPQIGLGVIAKEPVRLLVNMHGVNMDPVVERLNGGEAAFACSEYFDLFYEGQMIGPAVLALQDDGMAVVYPVVQWRNWPMIGVEFMEISEGDRQMIARSQNS
jgi:hypothetical protein